MAVSPLQNFYKEQIVIACGAGAENIYVSTKPVPTNGFLVISPGSESLREIIKYTGTGTDGDGDFVTVANIADRGLGGTTAQAHEVGEPIRMNYTAEHQKEIDDTIEAIVAGGTPDASTTVKGRAKLSVAPVDAADPIAVGDNDPRLPDADLQDAQAGGGDFGTPSGDNKFVTEGWVGFTPPIGGNSSDGVLNVTSGTTTLDLEGVAIFERNYESVNISSGATLAFSNPHANGTIIRIKSRGSVTIAGTINASGMGANGGPVNLNGLNPLYLIGVEAPRGRAGSGSSDETFGDGYTLTNLYAISPYASKTGLFYIVAGAGGGGGSNGNSSPAGPGGKGGGAVYIECSGELTFTGTINTSGLNGVNGAPVSGNNGSASGAGGGSAGMCIVRYGKLASNTGTILSAGGNGGNGGDRPDGSTTSGAVAYGGGGAGSSYGIGGGRPNSANASHLGAGGGGADGKRSGSGAGPTGGTGGGSMGGLVIPINY